MRVLDDEGRLFGRVNVVDALVVAVAVALVVGGAVVVLSDLRGDGTTDQEPSPDQDAEPFRYATVTFDAPLGSQAAGLPPGAELASGGETFDVTDVHRSVTLDGDAHVTARLAYRGTFDAGNGRVLAGDSVGFATNHSRIDVAIEAVGLDSGVMNTAESSVVLVANASSPGATTLEAGDELRVGGDLVGTVESIERPSDGGTYVGITVDTRPTPAGPAVGGRPLRVGSRIGLVTDEAVVRGRIAALGTSDPGDVE